MLVNNADVDIDVPYLDTALARCSLDAEMTPYGIEPTRAVDYLRRALRGLELCHRSRLIHRDIKPGNLFLSIGGDAVLGDFGIAAMMDSNGLAEPGGDMRIRAPELHADSRSTSRTDAYSMAVTLYALLAGRMPFSQPAERSA
jgi:serine/threonine protein kinase